MVWRNFNGQVLRRPIAQVVEEAIRREQSAGHKIKVCIGTDSQIKPGRTEFATVIVFLREKNGGFLFISQHRTSVPFSLKERLLKEVSFSIEVAYDLCDLLHEYEVALEVHADINTEPQFRSHDALCEAMGYIRGMGFTFKAKPEAFASSCCADRMIAG